MSAGDIRANKNGAFFAQFLFDKKIYAGDIVNDEVDCLRLVLERLPCHSAWI